MISEEERQLIVKLREHGVYDAAWLYDVADRFSAALVERDAKDAEIERLRAAAADEPAPYFRSDYEARVKAGTNGPDLWPYPRSCT